MVLPWSWWPGAVTTFSKGLCQVHTLVLFPFFLPDFLLSEGCLQLSASLHIWIDWHVPRPTKEQAFTSICAHLLNSLWCLHSREASQGKNSTDVISTRATRCHPHTQRPNTGQMKIPIKGHVSSSFVLCHLQPGLNCLVKMIWTIEIYRCYNYKPHYSE